MMFKYVQIAILCDFVICDGFLTLFLVGERRKDHLTNLLADHSWRR